MTLNIIEAKYTLGPRKIYESGHTVVIALGRKFKPLVGRYAFVTLEILREAPDQPEPKVKHGST